MGGSDRIQLAIEHIGKNAEKDDYVIRPTEHATALEQASPDLAAVLRASEIQVEAEAYERHDAAANAAQKDFKSKSSLTNWSIFLASTCSALILALSILVDSSGESGSVAGGWKYVTMAVALAGVAFSAIATTFVNMIVRGDLLQSWMGSRAKAEMHRIGYFFNIVKKTPAKLSGAEADLHLHQLEFFRRFQLDVQRAYYIHRGAQHKKAAQKNVMLSSVGLGFAALANGAAGYFVSTDFGLKLTAIAALAVIAKAWVNKITSSEVISQDKRNAERYGRVAEVLSKLYAQLDDVRLQVAAGQKEILVEYVEAVHEQLSAEHRQWMESIGEAGTAVGRFEESLKKLRAKNEANAPT